MVAITELDPVIHAFSALTKTASSAWMPADQVRPRRLWVRMASVVDAPEVHRNCDWKAAGRARQSALSRLDARPSKKYTSALS
jgi:hypothetical protein